MAKVPRNKGSYFPRKSGTGWQVKYPLGWSEEKRRYDEYHEDVATEAEAISLIKEINDFVYHGGAVSDIAVWRKGAQPAEAARDLTVSEFAGDYIDLRAKQGAVQERTLSSYRECFARVEPYIGGKPLRSVTPHDLDELYARMRSAGPDNLAGRPYSGTTVQKSHAFLRQLFSKALDYGYIDSNPCDKISSPKRDTREKRSLTIGQARALFSAIAAEPPEARPVGVLLALCCGLRLSEMLALEWSDYADGAICVDKSLEREKQSYKSTKNGEGRIVPCPPPLVDVLERWRSVQQRRFAELELEWGEHAPIVNSRVGNHILQRSFTKWFDRARKRYPIPDDFSFHGLRHTFVTLLSRDCGVDDRTARSLSGHKSVQAFQVYTHTNDESQRRAADALGDLLAPHPGAERCASCRYWSASPVDAARGACWAGGEERISVTSRGDACASGMFSARRSA